MGYVLRDGKRYYQDGAGNLMLDNVSQEVADRREARSATGPPFKTTDHAGLPPAVSLMLGALVLAVVMLVGALIHNHRYESPAEKAIHEYMSHTRETQGGTAP